MRGLRANEVLALPVRLQGIVLGYPVDVSIDLEARQALGLEIRCGDGEHRFLPLPAARVGRDSIVVGSSLTLLDDLALYRSRGVSIRSLRGAAVDQGGGARIGTLLDVVLDEEGRLVELLVQDAAGVERRVPFAPGLRVEPRRATTG